MKKKKNLDQLTSRVADGRRPIQGGSAVPDVSHNGQYQPPQMEDILGNVPTTTMMSSSLVLANKKMRRMKVGHCSQPTLISDRKVFKINYYHQPMMREEQLYNLVLHQVLYKPRKRKMMLSTSTRMQKMKSSILKLRRTQEG